MRLAERHQLMMFRMRKQTAKLRAVWMKAMRIWMILTGRMIPAKGTTRK